MQNHDIVKALDIVMQHAEKTQSSLEQITIALENEAAAEIKGSQTLAALDIVFIWYHMDDEADITLSTHMFSNDATEDEIKKHLEDKLQTCLFTIEEIER